jgi:hypothetical protein
MPGQALVSHPINLSDKMQPMRSPACHSERSEAALLRCPEPQAKELVAPRPFSSFRAAAGGRLRGAISGVARMRERSIASQRSFPCGFAQGCGSAADFAQEDSKGKSPPLQLEPLAKRVTPIFETGY